MTPSDFICCNCGKSLSPDRMTKITLNGETLTFCSNQCYNAWTNKSANRCFACGKVVLGTHQLIHYGDGRASCLECFQTAVTTPEQLMDSYRKVKTFFFSRYRYTPPCGVQPELYDRFVFKTNFQLLSDDIRGVYGRTTYSDYTHCSIGVLRGLPRNKFDQVLAHELAHDMMSHKWKFFDDRIIAEGFAEYMAYQFNIFAGEKALNEELLLPPLNDDPKDPDPYYNGLVKYLAIDEKGGYSAIEKFIERNM